MFKLATIGLGLILASSAAMAATATKPAGKPSADIQQYCLKFADDTGSHLTRTECRTKKQWKQLGVDVDELSDKGGGSAGLA